MKRDGRGGTEVSVKISCEEEEKRWCEVGAYVAIMAGVLISEIKRRRKREERRGVERRRKRGRRKGGVWR